MIRWACVCKDGIKIRVKQDRDGGGRLKVRVAFRIPVARARAGVADEARAPNRSLQPLADTLLRHATPFSYCTL